MELTKIKTSPLKLEKHNFVFHRKPLLRSIKRKYWPSCPKTYTQRLTFSCTGWQTQLRRAEPLWARIDTDRFVRFYFCWARVSHFLQVCVVCTSRNLLYPCGITWQIIGFEYFIDLLPLVVRNRINRPVCMHNGRVTGHIFTWNTKIRWIATIAIFINIYVWTECHFCANVFVDTPLITS